MDARQISTRIVPIEELKVKYKVNTILKVEF